MPHILTEVTDAIATITLDHERRRNALSAALVEEIVAALGSFRRAKARVVVLRAKPGAKVFSAGHDVDELPETRRDPLGWDDPLRQLIREIETFPDPVIAMVEGSVWGGATETVFACDLIVAADAATFRHAGQARCTLQCGRDAHLPECGELEDRKGDDLHCPAN
jgi:methylmalonyl-CoA decarboxylase